MAGSQQIFAVIAIRDADRVREAINGLPEESVYELKSDTWLVAYDGTTRRLAEQLGIRNGQTGSGLVVAAGGYAGRAPGDVWEWLRTHWAENG